jgi:hypothetical protein
MATKRALSTDESALLRITSNTVGYSLRKGNRRRGVCKRQLSIAVVGRQSSVGSEPAATDDRPTTTATAHAPTRRNTAFGAVLNLVRWGEFWYAEHALR